MRDKTVYTPMMQQYLTIKENYMDAFVFFRMGDFYELFFEDAQLASKELEIALTGRGAGTEERVPMCGVPHHAAEGYLNRLVDKGYKVAVCEQVEDVSEAKGVVRREVVRLLTPGTIMSQSALSEKTNNFIVALAKGKNNYSIAYSDLSTGENFSMETSEGELIGELINLEAREIVIGPEIETAKLEHLKALAGLTISHEPDCRVAPLFEYLAKGLEDASAFGRLTNYLQKTQKNSLEHLQPVKTTRNQDFLRIDYNSRRNLELTETIRSKSRQGSLLWLLDKSKTAMGSRLLKSWIERPSIQKQELEERYGVVSAFMADFMVKEELKRLLDGVYDLERLVGRVAYGNANARDLSQLQGSLARVPEFKALIQRLPLQAASQQAQNISDCKELEYKLRSALAENPPVGIKEGGMIKVGYDEKLDELHYIIDHGREWLLELEAKERVKTGIKNLKIKFNKVFGYYIEISKGNLRALPEDCGYVRKQTLVNAERFITPELKEKEELILGAEEKSIQLEYELFLELREAVKSEIPAIQHLAKVIAFFDVLQSFATLSEENRYKRPQLNDGHVIEIENGRHPVVEKVLQDTRYVENDVVMPADLDILLITGPNMSGKSTYMRQLALTAVMAQIGCFVPASEATLPVFDQIFTRIGAADDLVSGHSTFMVEMMETNHALQHATKNSLILLDEIGRGTATFDGMALAQSIIEHIHDHIGAKTLFSTHYHELTDLEKSCPRLQNRHVTAKDHGGQLIFLHKVMEGPSDKSYGIHVAQIAKLPQQLIQRAKNLLAGFEQNKPAPGQQPVEAAPQEPISMAGQLSLFAEVPAPKTKGKAPQPQPHPYDGIIDQLNDLDLYEMTPLQAMNAMYELKKQIKRKDDAS
ncbi:MAG: DNA mismatch repair protein MutS [Turicibacter sp.]|nr:DNA mismatch repair protein MutS [Turicibacter sp.]